MRKKVLCMLGCLFVLLSACSSADVAYDEDQVLASAKQVIEKMNNEDYTGILEMGNDQMKVLTEDKLKVAWQPIGKEMKAFQEFQEHEIITQDKIIVVGMITQYEGGRIQFTISFDADGKLAGLYFKKV